MGNFMSGQYFHHPYRQREKERERERERERKSRNIQICCLIAFLLGLIDATKEFIQQNIYIIYI